MNAPPRMICILVLRFLAFSTTLSAAIVMATSNETLSFFTNSVEISYSNSTAYKYFVIANGIVCGYSFLVLLLPSDSLLWRLVVALDGILATFLTSCASAALAVAYLENKGISSLGWQPICNQVPNYCNHITGALVACFMGLTFHVLLLLYSIHIVLNPLLVQGVYQ